MSNLTTSVCDILMNGILNGEFPPGSKLLPERDFAEKFSVSRITVRRAFARLEEAGIIVRKRPSGTYIADKFQAHTGDLKSIGLICNLPNEFSGKFVEAISSCCEKEDILLAFGIPEPNTLEAQLKIAVRMASRGVKNLIVWGANRNGDMQIFERLRILGVNLVFFDQVVPGNFADFVGLDNDLAIETLIDAGIKKGKKHFIFLNYCDMDIDSCNEREAAFVRKTAERGLSSEIVYLSYYADKNGKKACFEKLKKEINEKTALISVNAPLLHDVFKEKMPVGTFFCVDHAAFLNDIGASGYAQPIRAMAIEAVQMLRNQCRKGKKWRCEYRRFAGSLIEQDN